MLSFLLQFQHPSKTSITPECSSVKATFTNVFNQGYSRVVQILKRRITMAREISEGCNGWWKDAHHNPPTKSGSLYLPRLPSFYWVVVRFKYFLFSPLFGEDFQFWRIFFNWVETTNLIQTCLCLPLFFPTLPNGGQVGDIRKVWCSLFSIGWEVVATIVCFLKDVDI